MKDLFSAIGSVAAMLGIFAFQIGLAGVITYGMFLVGRAIVGWF